MPAKRVKASGSRKLLRREPYTQGLRYVYTRLIELSRAGLFAEALLRRVQAVCAVRRNTRGGRAQAEAVPLQVRGDRRSHGRATSELGMKTITHETGKIRV
jgi:hypothetical protein